MCEYEVKGANGIVNAFEDRIVISRKSFTGFIAQGYKGDREIRYQDMLSIEYKKPTMMANGYIQFIVSPEMAGNQNVGLFGSTQSALKDPNAVILRAFQKKTVSDGEAVHEYVMKQFNIHRDDANKVVSGISDADELSKFKVLLDEGTITQEEFDAKKKQILGL